jgi:hypothetical protein
MTLSDAIRLANRRGLATADFNLPDHARYRAMPQFVRDVRFVIGNPYWSKKKAWFHFNPDQDSYDLPIDFGRMVALRPYWNNQCCHPMQYVGEDPSKVLANSSADGTPYCGYQHPYRGGWYAEHTQNRYSFGPIGSANYGYAYAVSAEWPPITPVTMAMGQQPLVFASYDPSSALTPFRYSTAFLRFDTSTLPVEATITGAKLFLYLDSAEPIWNADGRVLLMQWYNEWPIDQEDYTPVPIDGAWMGTISKLVRGINELELLEADVSINRMGFSGLRLQLNSAQPEGRNELKLNIKSGGPFAEEFSPDYDKLQVPVGTALEIRYTVPIMYPFQLKLTGPVESAFDAEGLYEWVIPTAIMDPELDQYLPPNIQGLFVDKLECDILKDAFGQGDGRYVSARQEYDAALETLLPSSEAAPKRKAIYVR